MPIWHVLYSLRMLLVIILLRLCFFHFKQYPTKALAPLMLEDYRKVMVERRGEEEQFSYDNIVECMKKGWHFLVNLQILISLSLFCGCLVA